MTIVAAIRRMIDAGLDLEQALLAAEIFEAEMEAPRSKEAERAARYREKKKLAGVALSSAYPEDSVTTVTTVTTVTDAPGGLDGASTNLSSFSEDILPKDPPIGGPKGKVLDQGRSRHAELGGRVVDILVDLEDLPDSAAALHRCILDAMEAEGLDTRQEAPTAALGDSRDGRVDVTVSDGNALVAIEIDARKPRQRSIKKLRLFDAFRVIALRGVAGDAPEGIDAVVGLDMRQASPAEQANKSLRGCRLPDGWAPHAADWATAVKLLGDGAEGELAKFRDHWLSAAGSKAVKRDWNAAWRNWVRLAMEFRSRGRGPPEPPRNQYFAMLKAENPDAERHHASTETQPAAPCGPEAPSLDFEPDPLHPGRWEAVRTGV